MICCSAPSSVVTVLRPSKVIGVPRTTRMKATSSESGIRDTRDAAREEHPGELPSVCVVRSRSPTNKAASAAMPVAALTNWKNITTKSCVK